MALPQHRPIHHVKSPIIIYTFSWTALTEAEHAIASYRLMASTSDPRKGPPSPFPISHSYTSRWPISALSEIFIHGTFLRGAAHPITHLALSSVRRLLSLRFVPPPGTIISPAIPLASRKTTWSRAYFTQKSSRKGEKATFLRQVRIPYAPKAETIKS
jgi:hypothetical protein